MLVRRILMTVLLSGLSVAMTFAQGAIAGSARDASGAVLPGVAVEASSPALIEKVRTVFTDGAGQYKVVDLPPGLYNVTFTLSGFSTTKFDGIDLSSNFTANVNAEMKVGALEETVTVTGQSPVIDVHSASQSQVLRQEVLNVLPGGRSYEAHMAVLPAIRTGANVGGSNDMQSTAVVTAYGGRAADLEYYVNGMPSALINGSSLGTYLNEEGVQEVAVGIAAGTAEQRTAGVRVDQIPKQGGNQFHVHGTAKFAITPLQLDNITDDLRDRGLTGSAAKSAKQFDMAPSLGGPIKENRLWFFTSVRTARSDTYIPNVYLPDGSQAVESQTAQQYTLRLTGQLNRAMKVTAFYEREPKTRRYRFLENGNLTPEASVRQVTPKGYRSDAKLTYTPTSKVLAEVGFAEQFLGFGQYYQPSVKQATCFTAFALCAPGTSYGDIAKTELTTGITRGASPTGNTLSMSPTMNFLASVSYVTGSHAFKIGLQERWGTARSYVRFNGDLIQRYRNGVADSVIVRNTPINPSVTKANYDLGLFVQDSWTINRVTINPGIRFDYLKGEVPAQHAPAGRFVPARDFPAIGPPNTPTFKNVSPRFGVAYDVFGNGKTAIKGTVGKYVQQESAAPSAYNPLVSSTDTRTWADRDGNDIASEDELGPSTNNQFGLRRNTNPDPNLRRPYQMFYLVGMQQELRRGVAVTVSYARRRYYQMYFTDNLATTAEDYTLVTIPDPRGNGATLPVYNLNRAKLGLVDELVTNSDKNKVAYNGLDMSFTARFNGNTFTGGFSTGRSVSVLCEQEDPNNNQFCDETPFHKPLRTDAKMALVYRLPRGIVAGAVFQSVAGDPYERCGLNYSDFGITLFTGPRTCVSYSVGRTQVPTLTQASVAVRLNEPGTLYTDRINQLDLNIQKVLHVGRVQVTPRFDIYNAFNVSPMLDSNTTFGPLLGRPVSVLNPLVAYFNVDVGF